MSTKSKVEDTTTTSPHFSPPFVARRSKQANAVQDVAQGSATTTRWKNRGVLPGLDLLTIQFTEFKTIFFVYPQLVNDRYRSRPTLIHCPQIRAGARLRKVPGRYNWPGSGCGRCRSSESADGPVMAANRAVPAADPWFQGRTGDSSPV